ncbi:LysE family translocator [Leekyejoonella antrihumi]|uniref:LysE family translocator n=1 Tax=Leekyejoonella antrihumi TaxID=1660198 RepID=A0A563E702_9MICO|nr:LysE family translocator [Leekyejoonella antrihumi]TWP37982.1 LysE family translocator [Leekyejoonella antrihumi]
MRGAELGPFLGGAFLVLAAPGPSVLFAVTRTLKWGLGAGLLTVIGLEVGLCIHVLGAAFGLSALVSSSPVVLQLIRFAGAGYLVLLAVRGLRDAAAVAPESHSPPRSHTRWELLRAAFVVDVLNPKTVLFFLAFLPQFVRAGHGNPIAQFLFLGTCTVVIACVCDSLWVLLTAATRTLRARHRDGPPALSRRLARISSAAYVGIAVLTITG